MLNLNFSSNLVTKVQTGFVIFGFCLVASGTSIVDIVQIKKILIKGISDQNNRKAFILVFNITVLLVIISYLRAYLCDPGTYVDPSTAEDSAMNICFECKAIKLPRMHHCSTCRKCRFCMDHHCLWLANCVAYNNLKYFFLLVFYISVN